MTFVGHNEIERINRDIELVRVVVKIGIIRLRKSSLRTEQVSRHALNRRHVDEGMAQLWRGEILVWQNLRIKRGIVSEIFALKTLAVHFVLLRELITLGRIERIEFHGWPELRELSGLPEKGFFGPALTQADGKFGRP